MGSSFVHARSAPKQLRVQLLQYSAALLHAVGPLNILSVGHNCWVLEVYSLGV